MIFEKILRNKQLLKLNDQLKQQLDEVLNELNIALAGLSDEDKI